MPSRIIFIDSRIANYHTLITQLPAGSEVVLLDAERDGVMQIATALQGKTNLDAIDIISHGAPGSLKLSSSILNTNNLADYAAQLSEIGKHLSDDSDILLYGCDVVQGKTGRSFVDQLAQLTGADVAASDDTTGNTFVGANWDLEVSVGSIDTSTLVQSDIEGFGQNTLAIADNIFIEQGKDDGQGAGIKEAGVIRVLADFSKAAYDRQTWENPIYNDISINADVTLAAIKAQGWQPLDLTIPSLTTFDTFAIRDHLDSVGTTEHLSTNKMQGGYYTNHNAAAFVARSDDALVISFRGTNDNGTNPQDFNNHLRPDADEWGAILDGSFADMNDYYALLQPLITSLDEYIANNGNGINKVYVTGHSLGGAMAINYMNLHQAINIKPLHMPRLLLQGVTDGVTDLSMTVALPKLKLLRIPCHKHGMSALITIDQVM